MRYKRPTIRWSLAAALLVVSSLWLAAQSTQETIPTWIVKVTVVEAEMPNLSENQRNIISKAMELDAHIAHPDCHFELDATLEYIPSRVERFDPYAEEDSQWTLISIEDREPRERDHKQTPRYTRMSPNEAWYDLRRNIDWDSLKVANETADRMSFVGVKKLEVGKDEFVPGEVILEIDKEEKVLEKVTITMNEPHKINFFATIAAMTMTQNYRYDPSISRSMLHELSVDWKFRFFFARSSSKEHMVYRYEDCQPSSIIKSTTDQ
ncbi:MAG: hypothetical protein OXG15_03055 [Gammaproteobacteria bacterium]|nr:hypothetical protein [Gammaproteobacteria bacterium]